MRIISRDSQRAVAGCDGSLTQILTALNNPHAPKIESVHYRIMTTTRAFVATIAALLAKIAARY